MSTLGILLSLTTDQNDYQKEQAAAAREAAARLGVALDVNHAGGDPIKQTTLLMQAVSSGRYAAIVFEPVGIPLGQVAELAGKAGVGWVVLNREPDYLAKQRAATQAPVFCVSSDHLEVGRIQGRQARALLPQGGSALLIQGAVGSDAARERTEGLNEAKPENVSIRAIRGSWTEVSAQDAIRSWARLNRGQVDLVIAQNDAMGVGARKALIEASPASEKERYKKLPILGADGLVDGGQRWVREGLLTATIHIPANAGQALDLLVPALEGGPKPAAVHKTTPRAIPALDRLRPVTLG